MREERGEGGGRDEGGGEEGEEWEEGLEEEVDWEGFLLKVRRGFGFSEVGKGRWREGKGK